MSSSIVPLPFSVVIPAYNSEATICRAIESAQKATASQIIVVDDGSTDSTHAVSIAAGATCVQQSNKGAAKARIEGIRHVTQPFTCLLDADDELIAETFFELIQILQQHPEAVVAAGQTIGVSAAGRPKRQKFLYTPVNTQSLLQKGYGPWPPGCSIYRTVALHDSLKLSPEPLNPRFADDYELLIRVSRTGEICTLEKPSFRYTLSGGKSTRNVERVLLEKERIRAYYSEAWGVPIRKMTGPEIDQAKIAREIRQQIEQRNFTKATWATLKWFFVNPPTAIAKIGNRLTKGM